jgi:hypothetical protein
MRIVRQRLSWLVMLWFAARVAGLGGGATLAAFGLFDDCCADQGQSCPLHHPSADHGTCKMRNACPRADFVLLSIAEGKGIQPSATKLVIPFAPRELHERVVVTPIDATARPDLPPPRR